MACVLNGTIRRVTFVSQLKEPAAKHVAMAT